MGKSKWMSPGSKRKGVNLRAPATAKTQAGNNVLQVHWTPIFTRGKIRLYVCDEAAAEQDARLQKKLNDSHNLAKFVRHMLPGMLSEMQREYGWQFQEDVVPLLLQEISWSGEETRLTSAPYLTYQVREEEPHRPTTSPGPPPPPTTTPSSRPRLC